jgi:hypothetical protein
MEVNHRGLDLCMPHEMHERRQTNASPQHVGSKSMPKAVRVRFPHASGLPVMTKQRTQTGCSHAMAAGRSFERDEQRLATLRRPFQAQIVIEQLRGVAMQWQHANLFALAWDPDLPFRELEVVAVQC